MFSLFRNLLSRPEIAFNSIRCSCISARSSAVKKLAEGRARKRTAMERMPSDECEKPKLCDERQKQLTKPICAVATGGRDKPQPDAWEPEPPLPCDFRYDELHYTITDKSNVLYPRTWKECPPVRMVRKTICCFDLPTQPPLIKRKPHCRPQTACALNRGLAVCKAVNSNCPRITSPCCGPVRNPPKCHKQRTIQCKRQKCPYPSFSQCKKPKTKRRPQRECYCNEKLHICTLMRALTRMQTFKKVPNPSD